MSKTHLSLDKIVICNTKTEQKCMESEIHDSESNNFDVSIHIEKKYISAALQQQQKKHSTKVALLTMN